MPISKSYSVFSVGNRGKGGRPFLTSYLLLYNIFPNFVKRIISREMKKANGNPVSPSNPSRKGSLINEGSLTTCIRFIHIPLDMYKNSQKLYISALSESAFFCFTRRCRCDILIIYTRRIRGRFLLALSTWRNVSPVKLIGGF